ncbi:bacterial extracellular solute-binding s, 3 family protein [Paraburkholderia xenovorans LB400]|uniref:Amino acid ABC transporter substrate-binding protein, PAAT family n=1 Tax=Paraburkholderia xenovorans (strain LB400) TaxID=266265 RepID=Q13H32_PARXL|nr:ABC transporter substrate-binding protein [Paraburkholderia xenovorans]ABE36607.1 amino acid ABC transporter substrate-binding protein, PAAT family [Paraburkholderia xenovorans LB400]AIP34934.1 bacterial extracellular solute-binding s, 3 family protein [Paraburkholderia xenovorans LB400]
MLRFMFQPASAVRFNAVQRLAAGAGLAMSMMIGAAQVTHGAEAATLTAGSPPSSAPTTFMNVKTQQIEGLMPDVVKEIGKREGFNVSYDAVPFSALIQSVVSGKIDIIVAGMTPTARRAEVVDFSQPVTAFGEGIIVKDTNKTNYKSVQDLKGMTVGAPTGTDYGDQLKKLGIFTEVKMYDSPADMTRDVALGRIVAGFNDYPILKAQEAAGAMAGTRVDDAYVPMEKFDIAVAVKKGNSALLAKINDALTKMKADGSLDAILKKWHLAG